MPSFFGHCEQRTVAQRRCLRHLLAALSALVVGWGHASDAPRQVGETRFVIGTVRAVDGAGQVRILTAGAPVMVGDRIETSAGEHVHIRFVDNAFVGVRPGSRLAIERYDINGEDTAIRFKLEHGVVRTVTGEAAKTRKDRFRLNTPVAAIGVRGTDFVVQADADSLRAVVNQGAIAVAPFGGGCEMESFGPCVGETTLELSDHMGAVLLEMNVAQPARIIPHDAESPDAINPPVDEEPVPGTALLPAVEVAGVSQASASIPATGEGPSVGNRLVWGRWADPRPGDTLSVDRAQAAAGRDFAVGNAYASLFRSPDDGPVVSRRLGQVSFRLAQAEVAYAPHGGVQSAGKVVGGGLHVDFARRRFDTELTLSHALTGEVGLSSEGVIRENGIFGVTAGGTRVSGAVSFDGAEAGYLFDKQVPGGVFNGTTLWGR